MPCNSDYLEANGFEKEMSKVACLLDELEGRTFSKHDWAGYHKGVYCNPLPKQTADGMVAKLCETLQKVDVTKYSLEMQIWWRDHQAADKARVDREIAEAREAEARQAAISKLTPYERTLLGVK